MSKTTVTAQIEIQIPVEGWIDYLTQCVDIFGTTYYAGYWARGVEHDKGRGWLVWEHGDTGAALGEEPDRKAAVKAWRSGAALPKGWHRLDRDAAIRAFVEGAKKWGVEWFENGDGPRYDYCVQMALLGEERYG